MSYATMTDREWSLAKRAAARLMAAQPEPKPTEETRPRDMPRNVFWRDGRFQVRFGRGGRIVNVGTFETVEAAKIAADRFLAIEKKSPSLEKRR